MKPAKEPLPNGQVENRDGNNYAGVWLESTYFAVDEPLYRFNMVRGTWTVPNIGVPAFARNLATDNEALWGSESGDLDIGTWVGIDYDPLWQAGIMTHASLENPTGVSCYAWWEVVSSDLPYIYSFLEGDDKPLADQMGALSRLADFPVKPGDTVEVMIERSSKRWSIDAAYGGSTALSGAVKITFRNYTRGTEASFVLGSSAPFFGEAVFWITEQPQGDPNPGPVTPAFGAVYFDDAVCRFDNGSENGLLLSANQSDLKKHGVSRAPQMFRTANPSSGTGIKGVAPVPTDFPSGLVVGDATALGHDLIRCTYELGVDAWTKP